MNHCKKDCPIVDIVQVDSPDCGSSNGEIVINFRDGSGVYVVTVTKQVGTDPTVILLNAKKIGKEGLFSLSGLSEGNYTFYVRDCAQSNCPEVVKTVTLLAKDPKKRCSSPPKAHSSDTYLSKECQKCHSSICDCHTNRAFDQCNNCRSAPCQCAKPVEEKHQCRDCMCHTNGSSCHNNGAHLSVCVQKVIQPTCRRNGYIAIKISGGVAPYEVSFKGTIHKTLTSDGEGIVGTGNFPAGEYVIRVLDCHKKMVCEKVKLCTVISPLLVSVQPLCLPSCSNDGSFQVSICEGAVPLKVFINGPVKMSRFICDGDSLCPVFDHVPAGTYQIHVIDGDHQVEELGFTLESEIRPLSIECQPVTLPTCLLQNGSIAVSYQSGHYPLQMTLIKVENTIIEKRCIDGGDTPNNHVEVFENLAVGQYRIIVTDVCCQTECCDLTLAPSTVQLSLEIIETNVTSCRPVNTVTLLAQTVPSSVPIESFFPLTFQIDLLCSDEITQKSYVVTGSYDQYTFNYLPPATSLTATVSSCCITDTPSVTVPFLPDLSPLVTSCLVIKQPDRRQMNGIIEITVSGGGCQEYLITPVNPIYPSQCVTSLLPDGEAIVRYEDIGCLSEGTETCVFDYTVTDCCGVTIDGSGCEIIESEPIPPLIIDVATVTDTSGYGRPTFALTPGVNTRVPNGQAEIAVEAGVLPYQRMSLSYYGDQDLCLNPEPCAFYTESRCMINMGSFESVLNPGEIPWFDRYTQDLTIDLNNQPSLELRFSDFVIPEFRSQIELRECLYQLRIERDSDSTPGNCCPEDSQSITVNCDDVGVADLLVNLWIREGSVRERCFSVSRKLTVTDNCGGCGVSEGFKVKPVVAGKRKLLHRPKKAIARLVPDCPQPTYLQPITYFLLDNLSAGNYRVEIIDLLNQTTIYYFHVPRGNPFVPDITVESIVDPTCQQQNGAINLNILPIELPVNAWIELRTGEDECLRMIPLLSPLENPVQIGPLGPGNYKLFYLDELGQRFPIYPPQPLPPIVLCSPVPPPPPPNDIFTLVDSVSPPLVVDEPYLKQPTCVNNGRIGFNILSATYPVTVILTGRSFKKRLCLGAPLIVEPPGPQEPSPVECPCDSSDNVLTEINFDYLGAGCYCLKIEDSCSQVKFDKLVLTNCKIPLSITGEVIVSPETGAQPSYQFQYEGGNGRVMAELSGPVCHRQCYPANTCEEPVSQPFIIGNLSVGCYTLTITDECHQRMSLTFTIEPEDLPGPPPNDTFLSKPTLQHQKSPDGNVKVLVEGKTGPYEIIVVKMDH